MSSYVVEKEKYIKAAGLVAGIAKVKDLFIFDYQLDRKMTENDFYNKFCECYEMNKISVVEQYHDPEMAGPEPSEKDLQIIFKSYMQIGKSYMMHPVKSKDMIMHLRNFFQCAEYQTEKQSYYFKMKMFFNTILVALMPYLHICEIRGYTNLDFE